MMDLPDGEKSMTICLPVSTEFTNMTDRQTNTQTPHDGIGRAYAHRAAKSRIEQEHVQQLTGPRF